MNRLCCSFVVFKMPGSRKDVKKRRRPRKKKKNAPPQPKVDNGSQYEDDGTQVEMKIPVKIRTRPSRREKKKGIGLEDPESQQLLRNFCIETISVGVPGLLQQFNTLKSETSIPPPKKAFQANPTKNRYTDVYCNDETRVRLKWPPGSNDYVHANWVNFKGEKRFICTQGPMETTIDDFWRLVWQEKCKAIVMLCDVIEQNKKKCESYWPTEQGKEMQTSSGLIIKNVNIIQAEAIMTMTRLKVSAKGNEPSIELKHIKWNQWPDRGVPKNKMATFRLLSRIISFEPVLVHCSAGIGRTGTIVGLQMALQVLGAKEPLSMIAVVKELRAQRHGSVQTDIQYVFMHRVLINWAENKNLLKEEEVGPFNEIYEKFIEPH